MGDTVAQAVLAQFSALPKKGKPQSHEHTVLAGIVLSLPSDSDNSEPADPPPAAEQQEQQQPRLAVVAIGTGTKCLGASKRAPDGGAVNDCHGEVLCRRALLRWLYCEMRLVAQRYSQAIQQAGGQPDASAAAEAAALACTPVLRLVVPNTASSSGGGDGDGATDGLGGCRFELQRGVHLHLYISQPPCGDAAILAAPPANQNSDGAHQGSCPSRSAARHQEPSLAGPALAGNLAWPTASFGRTGAKWLKGPASSAPEAAQLVAAPTPESSLQQQPQLQPKQRREGGQQQEQWQLPQQCDVEGYAVEQAVGVVRRKPGRGDATLSMSCSDKLARWCLLGLQGSLLRKWLTAPLRLTSVTVSLPLAHSCGPSISANGTFCSLAPGAEDAAGKPAANGDVAVGGVAVSDVAAAAEQALRRALLDRTAELAAQRLPFGSQQATPWLHIHLPGAGAAAAAAAPGSAEGGLKALDLAPSATRTSAGGASLVWVAPPSSEFQWKQRGTFPTTALVGGISEAVIGSTGLKSGSGKVGAGQAVPAALQSSVCKAALFRQWQALAEAVDSLPLPSTPHLTNERSPLQRSRRACSYRAAKRAACPGYGEAWQRLKEPPSPLAGWIPKPAGPEDFVVDCLVPA